MPNNLGKSQINQGQIAGINGSADLSTEDIDLEDEDLEEEEDILEQANQALGGETNNIVIPKQDQKYNDSLGALADSVDFKKEVSESLAAAFNKQIFNERNDNKIEKELKKKWEEISAKGGLATEDELNEVGKMLSSVEGKSRPARRINKAVDNSDIAPSPVEPGQPTSQREEDNNIQEDVSPAEQAPSLANNAQAQTAESDKPVTDNNSRIADQKQKTNNNRSTLPENLNNTKPITPASGKSGGAKKGGAYRRANSVPAGLANPSSSPTANFAATKFGDRKLLGAKQNIEMIKAEVKELKRIVKTLENVKKSWQAFKAAQILTGESIATLISYWVTLNLQFILGGFEIVPGKPLFQGIGRNLGIVPKKYEAFFIPLNIVELYLLLIIYVQLLLLIVECLVIYYILTLGSVGKIQLLWDLL